jgi:hypothetical protein
VQVVFFSLLCQLASRERPEEAWKKGGKSKANLPFSAWVESTVAAASLWLQPHSLFAPV